MNESWQVLEEFPAYMISDAGIIINIARSQPMAVRWNAQGVKMVTLSTPDHFRVTRSVSILVANAFVKRPFKWFNSPIHLDGDRSNCRFDNLQWRPRWFAVRYHQQFLDPRFEHKEVELAIKGTSETFQGWKPPAVKYGLLYKAIIHSYNDGSTVFPSRYIFTRI